MSRRQRLAHYELLQPLGRGGMATVYLARDLRLDRPVALKLLRPELAVEEEACRRFRQEARAAARLDHPGVVPVYDWGQGPAGPYIAAAYIAGGSLTAYVSHHSARQGRLPLKDTLHILNGIADALDHAHRRGVVHRDVKPDNILLRFSPDDTPPRPMLTDFGLAQTLGKRNEQRGLFVGTPAYMAPEQVCDEAIDERADLYALGVVAFRLLMGELPLPIKTPFDAYRLHCGAAPPRIGDLRADLPPELRHLVQWALARTPAARLQSAAEFAATTRRLLAAFIAPRRRRPSPPLIALPAHALPPAVVAASLLPPVPAAGG